MKLGNLGTAHAILKFPKFFNFPIFPNFPNFSNLERIENKASLIKGRFGGIVGMSRSRPTPATKKKEKRTVSPFLVGHCIEISNPFLKDFEVVILFVGWIDEKVPNYR